MMFDPDCIAAKALGHSSPTLHWWLSLTATDQGTWATALAGLLAAIGGIAAALASFRAASLALQIAREDRQRQSEHLEHTGYVYAVSILSEVQLLNRAVEVIIPVLKDIASATDDHKIRELGDILIGQSNTLENAIRDIPAVDFSAFPKSCAAQTAHGLGMCRFALRAIRLVCSELSVETAEKIESAKESARQAASICQTALNDFDAYFNVGS